MISELIDSTISTFAPIWGVKRAAARKLARSYSGAESHRLNAQARPKNQGADAELLGPYGADALRAWARKMVRDNPYAWSIVDAIVSSVVGCGIHAQSMLETDSGEDLEDTNWARDATWNAWCEVCDINGQYTFHEMERICQREMTEAGEVLLHLRTTPSNEYRGISRPVPFAIELIEADRLAVDHDTYAVSRETGVRITRGVEMDDIGKPIAYWIYKDNPNSAYTAFERVAERIDAKNIIHLFRRDRIGQSRGVSWFAPVMNSLRDLGEYIESEMEAARIASCFGVVIKSDSNFGGLDGPDGSETVDEDGNKLEYLAPGIISRLRTNESIEVINPGRPNSGSEPWINLMLRNIAAGMGLSYEVVSRDYSQTNYSSSRTSELEVRRRYRSWQKYLVTHMCMPIWDRFCESAALSGRPEFPTMVELLEDRRKAAPVEWQTPELEWVDPQNEQAASQNSIDHLQSTYQIELGNRGLNYRQVFYQAAKERQLKKQLGLMTLEESQMDTTLEQAEISTANNASPDAAGAGESAPATNLAAEALNGAQVTSLMDVITQVGTGAMPKETAAAIISAAFPLISPEMVAAILNPIQPGAISADGTPAPIAAAETPTAGTGEMAGLSTMQFRRNRKAIEETLNQLAAGTISEAKARVFLSSIGMSEENIAILVADAADGSVDSLPQEAPANGG